MATNPSGITPPSDPSTQDRRSRSSRENLALVPAASIVLDRNRPSRPHQTPDHQRRRSGRPRSSDSSNPSIRSVDQNRRSYRPPARIGQSSQSSNPFSQGMNLPQASFVAGAAIHQAHQASAIAVEAATAAQNYQRESLEAQHFAQHVVGVAQQREQLHEAQMNQLNLEAAQRHHDAQAEVTRTQERAREVVQQTLHSAQQAVGRSEQELQQRAQQYVTEQESRLRSEMEDRFNRLRGEALDEVAIRERRIADLEAQLLGQQAAAVSIPKSVPVTPKALQFSPPQTQIVVPPHLGTPATNIVAGSPTNSHNPFAIPIMEVGGRNTPTHQVPLPPPLGHPVDFHPPVFREGKLAVCK